jgi:hypothetical protein
LVWTVPIDHQQSISYYLDLGRLTTVEKRNLPPRGPVRLVLDALYDGCGATLLFQTGSCVNLFSKQNKPGANNIHTNPKSRPCSGAAWFEGLRGTEIV